MGGLLSRWFSIHVFSIRVCRLVLQISRHPWMRWRLLEATEKSWEKKCNSNQPELDSPAARCHRLHHIPTPCTFGWICENLGKKAVYCILHFNTAFPETACVQRDLEGSSGSAKVRKAWIFKTSPIQVPNHRPTQVARSVSWFIRGCHRLTRTVQNKKNIPTMIRTTAKACGDVFFEKCWESGTSWIGKW